MMRISQSNGIGTIECDGFEALSRHDLAAGRELAEGLVAIADDDDIKVIVLTSSAADFCRDLPASDHVAAARLRVQSREAWHEPDARFPPHRRTDTGAQPWWRRTVERRRTEGGLNGS